MALQLLNNLIQRFVQPARTITVVHPFNLLKVDISNKRGQILKDVQILKDNNTHDSNQTPTRKSLHIGNNYFPKNGYIVNQSRLEPMARMLLMGVYDDNHPLSIFRGMRYIIKDIWKLAIQFNRHYYSPFINIKDNPLIGIGRTDYKAKHKNHGQSTALKQLLQPQLCHYNWSKQKMVNYENLKFPKALKNEININMMPIMMYNDEVKLAEQLPNELHGYIEYLRACIQADHNLKDKICFLTIHESYVEKNRTQRRPGLHIEFPGKNPKDGVGGKANWHWAWGGGYYQLDGIYMANSVSDSCCVWNCTIGSNEKLYESGDGSENKQDESDDIIGTLGSMEHLRCLMPRDERYVLEKDMLYWITDRTPHEALPQKQSGWRQFFRLVSHKLGAWYEDHSSKNPLGFVPDPDITKILKGNKFRKN